MHSTSQGTAVHRAALFFARRSSTLVTISSSISDRSLFSAGNSPHRAIGPLDCGSATDTEMEVAQSWSKRFSVVYNGPQNSRLSREGSDELFAKESICSDMERSGSHGGADHCGCLHGSGSSCRPGRASGEEHGEICGAANARRQAGPAGRLDERHAYPIGTASQFCRKGILHAGGSGGI